MLGGSRQFDHIDAARRRAYVLASAVATVVQVGILLLDVRTHNWSDLPSTVLGTLMSLGIIVAVRCGAPTSRLNVVIAGLITAVEALEFLPYLHAAEVRPQSFLSFTVLITLWFGLIPMRRAALLSAAAYAGFGALVLTRPVYDLSLLIYLGCVTTVVGVVSSFGQHVTGHQRDAAAFLQQSLTDALTGLPNRRALLEHLRGLWAQEAAGAGGFALLMIDLDHFKAVNDQYSHTVGDQVLVATGPALRALGGPGDVVARWGGEEFMLLLPDTTAHRAYATAARLNGAVLTLAPPLPQLTFSAGGALSHEAATLDQLLTLVDQRLHAAKAAGRQQVKWDTHRPPPGDTDERAAVH